MDKAAQTARKHMDDDDLIIRVQERLREKEFIARCDAVKMCHRCGKDWKNIEGPSSHHVTLACVNKHCPKFNKIKWNSRNN